MRKFLTAILVVWIPVTVFLVVRRIGLPQGGQLFIVFVTMAAVCVWAAKQEALADKLKLQKTASTFGFQPAEADDVVLSIDPLRGSGWIEGAACGELRGLQAWVFNYAICNRGGQTNKSIRQTVVAFRVDEANLPMFQIRPLDWSTSIFDGTWKNYDGDWEKSDQTICFPDALGFHRRFELMSPAEEGVRRHFDAKLLNTVAALNDCNYIVKGYNATVLVFTPMKVITRPDEMAAFARKGADIAYVLFAAEKRVLAAAAAK